MQGQVTYLPGAFGTAPTQDARNRRWLYHEIFDDFNHKVGNDGGANESADTNNWNITIGAATTVTQVLTLAGGAWKLTSAQNVNVQIQSWGPVATPAAGVDLWAHFKIKRDTLAANTGTVFVGFQDVAGATTVPALPCTAAGVATTGIDVAGMAIKPDGSVVSVVQNGSTTGTVVTIAAAAAVAADTFVNLSMRIRNGAAVDFWFNGTQVDSVTTSGACPNELLYADVTIAAGSSATVLNATIDTCWILANKA